MTQVTQTTRVVLEGRGPVMIAPRNHVVSGGEAHIYRTGNTIIKLYKDPAKMVRDGIDAKIVALSVCAHPYCILPEGLVRDINNIPVGYYMDYVDGEPLARVFTNDYRDHYAFTDDDATKLVARMHEVMCHVHRKGVVMVDANEMNWMMVMARPHDPAPRVLDTDSWALGAWGPRAIMPSIRDWHTVDFTTLTDWFAWGIVTFQIYVGIHPYKGRMPGYGPYELERRMRDNASVFHPDVRLNSAVRDFAVIPASLRLWYEHTFARGKRSVPPSPYDHAPVAGLFVPRAHAVATAGGTLLCEKLYEASRERRVCALHNGGAAVYDDGTVVDVRTGRKMITVSHGKSYAIVAQAGGWTVACVSDEGVRVTHMPHGSSGVRDAVIPLHTTQVCAAHDIIYGVTDSGITQLHIHIGTRIVPSVGATWAVPPYATQWFRGMGVTHFMDATHLVITFGGLSCAMVRTPELDGHRPLAGYADARFATVVTLAPDGSYVKYEFAFTVDYGAYRVWHDTVQVSDLCVTALPTGVCAAIVEDYVLDVFVPRSGAHHRIADPLMRTTGILARMDNTVIYANDAAVWRVRMR